MQASPGVGSGPPLQASPRHHPHHSCCQSDIVQWIHLWPRAGLGVAATIQSQEMSWAHSSCSRTHRPLRSEKVFYPGLHRPLNIGCNSKNVNESLKLGPRVKAFKEENDWKALTLGPSLGDSITQVWSDMERPSHIFAVAPFKRRRRYRLISHFSQVAIRYEIRRFRRFALVTPTFSHC